MTASTDVWAAGSAYEAYIGALTSTILAAGAPSYVCSVARSSGYATYARNAIADSRAVFAVADVQALALSSENADAAVSGLVLNFVPAPERAIAEMSRVLRRGGTVAVYVWDYAGEMQLIRRFWDAAIALDDRATALDEGRRFPVCDPNALHDLFRTAGLAAVETRAIDVATIFRDFSDYWTPFLGGQGPAPTYITSLTEPERTRLRDRLDAELPRAHDGRIELIARAWAVRGVRM